MLFLLILFFSCSEVLANDDQYISLLEEDEKIDVNSLLDNLIYEKAKKDNIKDIEKTDSKNAEIVLLNKITARSNRIILNINEIRFFGNISVRVEHCIKNFDAEELHHLMMVRAIEHKIEDEDIVIFHEWMSASNLSIFTMEHPVYEVIPMRCFD